MFRSRGMEKPVDDLTVALEQHVEALQFSYVVVGMDTERGVYSTIQAIVRFLQLRCQTCRWVHIGQRHTLLPFPGGKNLPACREDGLLLLGRQLGEREGVPREELIEAQVGLDPPADRSLPCHEHC